MKRNKKLLIILMVLIISPLIIALSYTLTANAYVTQSLGGNQSYKHRQFDPNIWDGSLSPGTQGERWLLKSVNVSRNNFHNWLATGYTKDTMKMGAHGLENPNSYTPPSGWEIHTVLKYPVYTPRSYPVSIKDCTKETKGTATAPWTEPKKGNCSPSTYQTGLSSNSWVLSINAAHWEVYDTNAPTWEGKTGPFYLFNAAQINGYAYDVRIVKKGGPPVEPSPEPDPGGGGGETEPEGPPPPPPNEPPNVNIEGPTMVMAGETFCLKANASDPDGQIINYSWSYSGVGKLTGSDGCELWYEYEGDKDAIKTVSVTVMDDDGATASDTHQITVVPPNPTAGFEVSGTLKENRKVTITDKSKSPEKYPITDEVTVMTGEDNKETVILYKPLHQVPYNSVQVRVIVDSNKNGIAEASDGGFEYDSDIHGFDKPYAATFGKEKIQFMFALGNADSASFFKDLNLKVDVDTMKVFVLNAQSKYELITYDSEIVGDRLIIGMLIQEQ